MPSRIGRSFSRNMQDSAKGWLAGAANSGVSFIDQTLRNRLTYGGPSE